MPPVPSFLTQALNLPPTRLTDVREAQVAFGGDEGGGVQAAALTVLRMLASPSASFDATLIQRFQSDWNRDVGSPSLPVNGLVDSATMTALRTFVTPGSTFGTDLNQALGGSSNVSPVLTTSTHWNQTGYSDEAVREASKLVGYPTDSTEPVAERDVQLYPLNQDEFQGEGDDFIAASALNASVTPGTITAFQLAYNNSNLEGMAHPLQVDGILGPMTKTALATYSFLPKKAPKTITYGPNAYTKVPSAAAPVPGYAPPHAQESVFTSSNVSGATPSLPDTALALFNSRDKSSALVLPFQVAFNATGANVHLAPDGRWGPATAAALAAMNLARQVPRDTGSYPVVRVFQNAYNAAGLGPIAVDGQYGRQTATALGRYAPAGVQAPTAAMSPAAGGGSVLGSSRGAIAPSALAGNGPRAHSPVKAPAVAPPSLNADTTLSPGQKVALGGATAVIVGLLGWLGVDTFKKGSRNSDRGAATVRTRIRA